MTDDPENERRLIEAAQSDPGRFLELYERYFDRVYAFASRRTRDRAMAEDATAATFEHALSNLRRFEWRGMPFGAWLFRIAANAIADCWRADAHVSQDPPADAADSAELDAIERRVMLFDLVEQLPETQRDVVRMRFGEEKSIREVAAALGRSEGAVKQLQLRALENLRKRMNRDA